MSEITHGTLSRTWYCGIRSTVFGGQSSAFAALVTIAYVQLEELIGFYHVSSAAETHLVHGVKDNAEGEFVTSGQTSFPVR
jgi:hypothetical protein